MIVRKEACTQLEVNMYYNSRWNHIAVKQGVFSRLKITYYIVFFTLEIYEVSDFSNLQFLEKMQKLADCQNAL